MRISELRLEKYGPFEGRSLHFRQDARLHLVFGLNEAGKSSALAAVIDLLFGIEQQTRYAFHYPMRDLRLGGVIEAASGQCLNFQRRKGTKNTLFDAAGEPIQNGSLLPFLGTVDRDVFRRVFGLNTVTLRAGAETMLQANGEIGQTLFDVASGLHGMLALRASLEEEAGQVFAPRASKDRHFYQILDRYETARKQVRELALKADDWRQRTEEIEALKSNLAEIEQKQADARRKQAHLARLRRAAPLVRLIDQDLDELGKLGELPEAPEDLPIRLGAALDELDDARRNRDRTAYAKQALEADLSAIAVDEAILAAGSRIQQLFANSGAYDKAQNDLLRIRSEAENRRQSLAETALRLGLADAEEVERRLPTDMTMAAVRELIDRGGQLMADGARCGKAIAGEESSLHRLQAQTTVAMRATNPRILREKFGDLNPILRKLDLRTQAKTEFLEEQRALTEEAARLHPTIADLAALSRASLPGRETIDPYRRERDLLRLEHREAEKEAQRLETEIGKLQRRLQSDHAAKHVPSREEIRDQRVQRDQAWSGLRAMVLGEAAPPAEAELAGIVAAYEQAVRESDRLADSAFDKAEVVAKRAGYQATLDDLAAELNHAHKQATEISGRIDLHDENWKSLWQRANVVALSPAEMADWLARVEPLFDRLRKNNRLQQQLTAMDKEISAALPDLEKLAKEVGVQQAGKVDPGGLATAIEKRLRATEKDWDKANQIQTGIKDAESRIEELKREAAAINGQLDGWREQWSTRLRELGLKDQATVEEAKAALDAWGKVPSLLHDRKDRLRRIAGMERDSRDFEQEAEAILEDVATDLAGALPAPAAARELNDRLGRAVQARTLRDQTKEKLAEATRAEAEAERRLEEAGRTVAGFTPPSLPQPSPTEMDLRKLVGQLERRNNIRASLNAHRRELIAQGDENQLRRELDGFDPVAAETELQQLDQNQDMLNRDWSNTSVNRELANSRLEELSHGIGGELANQELKNAEAELAEAAHQWTVLKLGALLIASAIEKKRKEQKDPLIERASGLFSTITGGMFTGIAPSFGEDDQPVLEGRRNSGELVSIPGLSEGTRDQLYFALRLAYIEGLSDSAEPVPFLGDDLFTSFDDKRTAQGIEAMAAIGNQVQPILFTHHAHVVEIARESLGEAVDVIDLS